VIVKRRSIAASVILQKMALPRLKNGPDLSSVPTHVAVFSTAANMRVSKRATDRTRTQHIVRDLPTSLLTALVARRVCLKFRTPVEKPVRILYQIARNHATLPSTVAISASNHVIRASACLVWRPSPLHADVDGTPFPPSVIRAPRRLHSACAYVVLPLTADDTSAVSIVALASVKQPSDKPTEGSHALWTQHLNVLETTSKQSTSAPVRAVAS
jgi:hypothetical protein